MSFVIVAIPKEDDYIWKISSEKVPHLTLCFLGDQVSNDDFAKMAEFLQHAAATSLTRFGMSVDRRGTLGPDEADVLFFNKSYSKEIETFRAYLLANETIAKAYASVEQYPQWTPHITLGYPETPANPDERDYPGISWVNFDRIAIWSGDFDGPEFVLKEQSDLAMSDESFMDSILKHYGVKGMRWGVRRSDKTPTPVSVSVIPGRKIVTKGGKFQPASDDALKTATSRQKARKSTVNSLSNKELQELVQRMNLEQQYSRLSAQKTGRGRKFVQALFGDKQKAQKTMDSISKTRSALDVSSAIKNADLSGIGK